MKEKTLSKEFVQYVALNICGMMGLSCYILADTFFEPPLHANWAGHQGILF